MLLLGLGLSGCGVRIRFLILHVAEQPYVCGGFAVLGFGDLLELTGDEFEREGVCWIEVCVEQAGVHGVEFAAAEGGGDEGFDFGEVGVVGEEEFVNVVAEFRFVVGVGAQVQGLGVEA